MELVLVLQGQEAVVQVYSKANPQRIEQSHILDGKGLWLRIPPVNGEYCSGIRGPIVKTTGRKDEGPQTGGRLPNM